MTDFRIQSHFGLHRRSAGGRLGVVRRRRARRPIPDLARGDRLGEDVHHGQRHQRVQKPTLVIAHNKTLAAQLCNEFREFLPDNAVEYFVSYYDYYQPEAYVPAQDLYIEKDSSINDEIDRLRHSATTSLFLRRDVVIVASVSCIYGLGSPEDYLEEMVLLQVGDTVDRDEMLRKLVDIQYARNDFDPARGKFRVRGDSVEIWPAAQDTAVRVQFFGDQVEQLVSFDPVGGEVIEKPDHVAVYPATHFVTNSPAIDRALVEIARELEERCAWFEDHGKVLEAHRLRQRTRYDMEMLREMGFCNGIENYSRILLGKEPGATPNCLLDYFPTTSCASSTNRTCRSRRSAPCPRATSHARPCWSTTASACRALSTTVRCASTSSSPRCPRSLRERHARRLRARSQRQHRRADHRPTGLVDPQVQVRPTEGQIDDLMNEIRRCVDADQRSSSPLSRSAWQRISPTTCWRTGSRSATCTARSDTLERIQIVRDLRLGEFDVLVGINLLREGSICPRSPWSPSSTRTRKASCAVRRRSSRPSAAPRVTSTAESSCTLTS